MRVFPVKAYAFVNFAEIASAIKAMGALEGVPIPALVGGRERWGMCLGGGKRCNNRNKGAGKEQRWVGGSGWVGVGGGGAVPDPGNAMRCGRPDEALGYARPFPGLSEPPGATVLTPPHPPPPSLPPHLQTGVKPLVMRYQQEAVVAAAAGTGGSKPPGVGPGAAGPGRGGGAGPGGRPRARQGMHRGASPAVFAFASCFVQSPRARIAGQPAGTNRSAPTSCLPHPPTLHPTPTHTPHPLLPAPQRSPRWGWAPTPLRSCCPRCWERRASRALQWRTCHMPCPTCPTGEAAGWGGCWG